MRAEAGGRAVLDCGCVITAEGRAWCPTCSTLDPEPSSRPAFPMPGELDTAKPAQLERALEALVNVGRYVWKLHSLSSGQRARELAITGGVLEREILALRPRLEEGGE